MTRWLAIDYGDVRIGTALTDPLKMIATGFETVPNNDTSYARLHAICLEKGVDTIVFGIPFNADSEVGPAALKALNFARSFITYLAERDVHLEYYEQDERYTTVDAHETMRKAKVKTKKKRKVVDQIAASAILKSFMDSRKKIKLNIDNYLKDNEIDSI